MSVLLEPILARYSEDPKQQFQIVENDGVTGELHDFLVIYNHPHDLKKGMYRHTKSQRKYRVLGIVISPSTSKVYVWYQAQHDSLEFGERPHWVRPIDNFMENVHFSDGTCPRFQYLGW